MASRSSRSWRRRGPTPRSTPSSSMRPVCHFGNNVCQDGERPACSSHEREHEAGHVRRGRRRRRRRRPERRDGAGPVAAVGAGHRCRRAAQRTGRPRPQLPRPRGRQPPRAARDRPRRGGGVRRRGAGGPGCRRCPARIDDFLVTTAGGRRVGARRILVTGGVVDELPDVPGLAERWGMRRAALPRLPRLGGARPRRSPCSRPCRCPRTTALLFRQLSDDVVMVVHDGVEIPDEETRAARPRSASASPTAHRRGGHRGRRAGRAAPGRRLGPGARRDRRRDRSRTSAPTSSAPWASSRSRSR